MKIQGIYKIINCINGKVYIGQSNNINNRFSNHKSNIKKYFNYPLYNAFRKYGIENFEFTIIEHINNVNDLDTKELYWINHYKSNNRKYGYNIRLTCKTNRGLIHSKKTRKKLSEIRNGTKHSEKTKLKIGLRHKGKVLTEEHKRKISESHKGKSSGMLGKKHTNKARVDMSLSHKGKIKSEETKRKIGLSLKGKKKR